MNGYSVEAKNGELIKLERLDWARQLERIERIKAKERMGQGVE